MKIELSEQDELIIQRLLEAGAYEDRASVVDAALAALEPHEKQTALDDSIQRGLDSGVDEDFSWDAVRAEGKASQGT